MSFSDNLKYLRIQKGATQKEVAEAVGITIRTLQNYEMGSCYPRREEIAAKLAEYFEVPLTALLSPEDYYIIDASKRGGTKAERELSAILSELTALFSGGKLSEADKDLVMKTMNEIYWDSKEKAKEKYSHKKALTNDHSKKEN